MRLTSKFYIFFVIVFFPFNAYAYLDPGTGGLIIQVLVASLISIGVFFSTLKNKIINAFYKLVGKKNISTDKDNGK